MRCVLGIETSCDETAASVVAMDDCDWEVRTLLSIPPSSSSDEGGDSGRAGGVRVLSSVVFSQIERHALYGGVVPEIAARAHLEHIDTVIQRALREACVVDPHRQLDAIAVTQGPGLVGCLIVGIMTAQGLAVALNKPLVATNHLEAHALSVLLEYPSVTFPYLVVLVSGGHTQIIYVEAFARYYVLAATLDDSVGESFDKVAKFLDLPYPGGPEIEQRAQKGDDRRFAFPKPMLKKSGRNMSFSGLKTAVRNVVQELCTKEPLTQKDKNDVCACFQTTIKDVLINRIKKSLSFLESKSLSKDIHTIAIVGGVASNQFLRKSIASALPDYTIVAPSAHLCTDNAAMIAYLGILYARKKLFSPIMNISPRARWPISSVL